MRNIGKFSSKGPQKPVEPTREEWKRLSQCIDMADWHFDILKTQCTLVGAVPLHWNPAKKDRYANVYGLRAQNAETNESIIANLFIRFQNRVYQSYSFTEITLLLSLLKKEYYLSEYFMEYDNWLYERDQWRETVRKARNAKKGLKVA